MKIKVLVTGGRGFIGRALVERLSRDGAQVVSLDNDSRHGIQRPGLGEQVTASVLDRSELRRHLDGCDTVVHLAAVNGTQNFYSKSLETLEIGAVGTLNVLSEALEAGVNTFVFMSSSEVYGLASEFPTNELEPLKISMPISPRSSYSAGKLVGEVAVSLASERLNTLVVRPHNVYGPGMGFDHVIPQLLRQFFEALEESDRPSPLEIAIEGSGAETRAFCFLEDFIDALDLLISSRATGVFNVGTDQETSITQLVAEIADCLGVSAVVVPRKPLKPDSPVRRVPDISRMRSLGYSPKYSLAMGLDETIRWYFENFKKQARG